MPTANVYLIVEDAEKLRGDKPTVLLSYKDETGVAEVMKIIREKALFK
jgi:Ni2+-binding GTPase involved in maturation of urease and hydrogenase